MQKIKFLKDNSIHFGVLKLMFERIICTFNDYDDITDDMISNGFVELNEHNDTIQGNYEDYKYIYKKDADCSTIILTIDPEDIYKKPEIPSIPETDVSEYTPTIDDIKNQKINELSNTCNLNITNGVHVQIGENLEHFSYKDEDQVNIKELFDLAIQTQVPLYYHADGLSCKLYTVEQIINIYTSNAINKMHHITYFNQLKLYIKSLSEIDDVKAVNYGDELTGKYFETYNEAMQQAKLGMSTLLGVQNNENNN